ncbi:MAG: phosphoribosylglycinamide formyltransferase [Lachnospiraceae bacterium]|nr:phosphoribosylglycinamide formyltransferase [Lachnospiraceae bacterium]
MSTDSEKKFRITVMVSGGGTNLQAIIDAIASGRIKDTEIVRVISNKKDAFALKRAEKADIPAVAVCRKDYPDREAFEKALLDAIDKAKADLVVLAGFLVVLPSELTEKYAGRIINIHPSLIPSFCGKGYYGLKVHEEALNRGVKVTGATVHFVDSGCDTGPIIMQKAVQVEDGDTPEILQRRVMEQAEWVILPEAIDQIAHGKVVMREGKDKRL